MDSFCERVKKEVLDDMDFSAETSDERLLELIDRVILRSHDKAPPLKEREKARQQVFNALRGLDVLSDLIENDEVTEIMVNGYKNIFYEKAGELYRYPQSFSSKEKYEAVVMSIAASANKVVNESSPICDCRLKDSRVNIVMNPISIDGAALTIRRFPKEPLNMENLISMGALSKDVAEFLRIMVLSGMNAFISGGTGCGKTTFLNALSGFIPRNERIITIEDSAELNILDSDNVVRLEARSTGEENMREVTIRMLIKSALRMRPDRIIVGECRGAEALDMLQAMNTGHDGSLSTGHANSCEDMISRLETMVLMGAVELPVTAIRSQIASGIDLLIHLGRLRDRSRRLLKICEVSKGADGGVELNPLYEFEETGEEDGKIKGVIKRTGKLINRQKVIASGLEEELEKLYSIQV
ncbi:MAG: Flp pilus assembly complex ATPase component TadA [Lachnospiraceae bacterium]|nr:Flp pilus assembly complex ATPase component TadA [Lachnospiraceae bacterium]